MSNTLERPVAVPPKLRQLCADFGPCYAANGFIGCLFAATAPMAIILSVGTQGGLSAAQLASWLFGAFFVNGLITIAFCWLYRQPLAFFWTIPGTVLVGPVLTHLSVAKVLAQISPRRPGRRRRRGRGVVGPVPVAGSRQPPLILQFTGDRKLSGSPSCSMRELQRPMPRRARRSPCAQARWRC